jgi:hypothetical protein
LSFVGLHKLNPPLVGMLDLKVHTVDFWQI